MRWSWWLWLDEGTRVHPWILLETGEYHRMSSREQISHPWIRSAFCSLKDLMVPSDRRSVNALVSSSQHPTNCRCCAEDVDHGLAFMNSSSVPLFLLLCLSNRTSPTESQFSPKQIYTQFSNRLWATLSQTFRTYSPSPIKLNANKKMNNFVCSTPLSFIFHWAPSENYLL